LPGRIEALRGLLTAERSGVLATLSARRDGWPFTSVVPYALTDAGQPILLLSDLAEHTRNLRSDPRASLFILDSAARNDPQAGARLTLLGRIEPAPPLDVPPMQQRYLHRHPSSENLFNMQDFRLYILNITEARFISGFGDMGWIEAAALLR
jgi:heme iron utilization protein